MEYRENVPYDGTKIINKIKEILSELESEKTITGFYLTFEAEGKFPHLYFSFLYEGKELTGSFPLVLPEDHVFLTPAYIKNGGFLIMTEEIDTLVVKQLVEESIKIRIRGYQTEQQVFQNLIEMKKDPHHAIERVFYSNKIEDTIHAIDILIETNYFIQDVVNPKMQIFIPIQVKSSSYGQFLHMKLHPGIPSIVYSSNTSPAEFERIILKIIKEYTRFFFKRECEKLLNIHVPLEIDFQLHL